MTQKLTADMLDTRSAKSMTGMFKNCTNIEKLEVQGFNTFETTTFQNMFENCTALTELDLRGFRVGDTANTDEMFESCTAVTTAYAGTEDMVSTFNASTNKPDNVVFEYKLLADTYVELTYTTGKSEILCFDTYSDMAAYLSEMTDTLVSVILVDITGDATSTKSLFENCINLIDVDLSLFNTNNVTDMSYMFSGCSALETVDVTNVNTSNVTDMTAMFAGCTSLTCNEEIMSETTGDAVVGTTTP